MCLSSLHHISIWSQMGSHWDHGNKAFIYFILANVSISRAWKTPLQNDKYHTFETTFYYEVNKPKN